MAIYRNIQMSFWTDTKVMDEFSPAQKFLYLYLLTNPHTNLCGCYEISKKQIAYETGMTAKQVDDNIRSLQDDLQVIAYSDKTKEILLINWSKYNWTTSEKFRKPLAKEINSVKDDGFRKYLIGLFDNEDAVSIPYEYGSDTTVTVTDTVPDTVPVPDPDTDADKHDNCDDLKEFFNNHCKSLPSIKVVNQQRKANIRNLLKTYTVGDIRAVFEKAEASDFLSGRSGKWNGCGFDWLIKPSNFIKVLEGNYDNKDDKDLLKQWAEGDDDGQETNGDIIDIPAFFVS